MASIALRRTFLQKKTFSKNFIPVRNITFGPEHDKLRETVKKIVDKDIAPYVDEWEAKGQLPTHELFKKFGQAGLLGITRDTEYGGAGLDYSYSIAFFEELGHIQAGGVQTAIEVHTDMSTPAISRFGSDYIKRNFLAPAIAGDMVSCVGVSEITGGSDVAALKSYARRDGDDYVINGSKMWISNGAVADWMCMLVNTNDGPVHKNKSIIIVPMKEKGVTVARKISKMGLLCSDTAEIYFDNVRVPAKNLVGEEGMGFIYQMMQFQDERICVAATTCVTMEDLLKGTIEYCRSRQAFDIPLIDNQYIYFKLAELQSEIELLRSAVYRAADLMIKGEDATYLATCTKLKAGRLARIISDQCLQFFGGMGYTSEIPISRAFRDSRVLSIAGGTDEIMLGILAKMMDILPKRNRAVDIKK